MDALGSPSISRAPMGGAYAYRTPKSNVCRWQVERQYDIVRLPEIHFTAPRFLLKIFDRLCVLFFSILFFFLFFLRIYTLWQADNKKQKKKKKKKKNTKKQKTKKKKKKKHKNNKNLQTGRTNTLLFRSFFFQIITWKEHKVYVFYKRLHQNVPYSQNESCLACK